MLWSTYTYIPRRNFTIYYTTYFETKLFVLSKLLLIHQYKYSDQLHRYYTTIHCENWYSDRVSTGEKLRCVVHKSPDSFHLDSTIWFCPAVVAAAYGINDSYTINFQGRARVTLEIRIRKQRLPVGAWGGGRGRMRVDFATTTQRV